MVDKTIQILIPGIMVERVEAAFCNNFGYQDQVATPDWVFDEKKPEITSAPMINNKVINQIRIRNTFKFIAYFLKFMHVF